MEKTDITREAWMERICEELRPTFESLDAPLPKYRVTLSLTPGKRVVGVCFNKTVSADGVYEILIRLDQAEPLDVAAVLAHELIHAAVGLAAGHGKPFGRVARALGLEGPLTATRPGEAFKKLVAPILEKVGPFPHAPLQVEAAERSGGPRRSSGPKPQKNRQIKCRCVEPAEDGSTEVCGYTCRTTRMWIERGGAPLCPIHSEPMVVEGEEEEADAA